MITDSECSSGEEEEINEFEESLEKDSVCSDSEHECDQEQEDQYDQYDQDVSNKHREMTEFIAKMREQTFVP